MEIQKQLLVPPVKPVDKLLVFLDTETTGRGPKDRLVQVAYKVGNLPPVCELFKAPLPVSLDAMTVNHITNKMLIDKPPFQGSYLHLMLHEIFHRQKGILVAHNADFDLEMLKKEDIYPDQYICTMKVARHLDTEDRMSNYKMQYLRYYWEIEADVVPHTAHGDIVVLEKIYEKLAELTTVDEMIHVSKEPFLLRKLTFGKYKEIPVKDIPRDYLIWLRRQENIEGDLAYTLDYYINLG